MRPGIIPLRPLGLGELYDGAIKLIRGNPVTVLGLSAAVVSISQIIPAAIQAFAISDLMRAMEDPLAADTPSMDASSWAGVLIQWTILVFLTGLVTAIAGRAVFGQRIGAGEAWRLVRPRILTLIVLMIITLLLMIGFFAIVAVSALALRPSGMGQAILGGLAGFLIALPPTAYVWVKISLAAPAAVFERLGVGQSLRRSFTLVRGDFWRVLGIELLTVLLVLVITFVIVLPFGIIGVIVLFTSGGTTTGAVTFLIINIVGGIIGSTITAPFQSTVIALLYVDRRMRAEAFDLKLRAYATRPPTAALDDLWDPARP